MRAQIYILMKSLKAYEISFFGLKEGIHHFKYEIGNQFFEAFNYNEFFDANILVNLEFIKKSNMLELHFTANGIVNVACDLSNERYDQPISGDLNIVVKFGDEFNDDNEEILIIPHGEHQLNVAQFIYEMLVLAVPSKKIHPGIEDGSLQSDIIEKLKELQPRKQKKSNEIDPRWEDLKKLLTDKNT